MADEEKTKSKNIVTIEESGPCKKKISIEVPAEAIKEKLDEQYNELRRDAEVPGFRKGRAPLRLLEKKYGSDVRKQVKLKLLAQACELQRMRSWTH
jgi:trigger factor